MKLEAENELYMEENSRLRQKIATMQNEIYGARLAAKYLDKELAGRIQQIQLLGRDIRGAEHDRIWQQLEAEIHLHRHKTVIKACRGREYPRLNSPAMHEDGECIDDDTQRQRRRGIGRTRRVNKITLAFIK